MKRKTRIVILFSFNLIYLLVGYGSTRYVTTTGGATTKDGRSWATAYQGLQAALTSAVSGDEIWVAFGTYHPTSAYSLTNSSRYYHFEMKNGVTIYGGLAGTETIISERTDYGHGGIHETILSGDIGIVGNNTDNCYHVFYHNGLGLDATAKLDGFTITGGRIGFDYPHNGGGGMYNRGSCSPTITNCSFISNSAESAGDGYGGGILNNHSSPVIANCIFTSNYGDHGGGIYNEQSSPTITNCRFTSNSGYNGGGIFNSSSSPAITNCIFISNSVSNEGGGIFNFQGGSPIIVNCTFSLNSAALGGGLNNRVSSSPTLNNCIVWGNTATTKGNQFYIDGGGTSMLNYCCYANGPGDITVLNGTFTPDINSIISNPLFVGPLVNPNHPYSIQGISPCADAGKDSYNSEMFDIRGKGYPRKLSKTSLAPGKIDIGAYEFNLYDGLDSIQSKWIQTTKFIYDGNNLCFGVSGLNIFAGTQSGIFLSTDNGVSWNPVNSGLTNKWITSFAVLGGNLFVGTSGGVFLSTDNGTSWVAVNQGLKNTNVYDLAISGANLFAATEGDRDGVFLSTNNGTSWKAVSLGFVSTNITLTVAGTNLIAGTTSGIFLSANNGTSWIPINNGVVYNSRGITALAASGNNLFAGTSSGVYISTNNGTSWKAINTGLKYDNNGVSALTIYGPYIFAGTTSGVFLSTNNGTSWVEVNEGLTNPVVYSLAICGKNIFVGKYGGIWRRPLSEMIPDDGCKSVSITSQPQSQTVASGSTATFSVSVNGSAPFSYVWYKNGIQISNTNNPSYTTIPLSSQDNGSIYKCVIKNCDGLNQTVSNNAVLTVTGTGCVPIVISSQPQSRTISAGNTATFNVVANGSAPFIFSWYKNNSQIPGATSATYTTGVLAATDNGSLYKCIITNCNGANQVTSSNALLTVTGSSCAPITITSQPQSKTQPVGCNATFSVSVSGTAPFTYSWYKNNVLIPGATQSSYTTNQLSIADNGSIYKCVISNCNHSSQIASSNAVLSVVSNENSLTFYHIIPTNKLFSVPRLLFNSQTGIGSPHICADGSSSTVVSFTSVGFPDMKSLNFRIKENNTGRDSEHFGSFATVQTYADSIVSVYTHPLIVENDGIKNTITIQVYNNETAQIIKELPIDIYRAPVLMVHGLWSDASKFEEMENALFVKYYPSSILRRANYAGSNASSFSVNKDVVFNEINYLMFDAVKRGYSCGKVDVIAHSMGGLLTRRYIQNKETFANNINRLITMNTPHAGTQIANLLLKSGPSIDLIRYLMNRGGNYVDQGAVHDLQFNSDEITDLRNGETKSPLVPKRAIVTSTTEMNGPNFDVFLIHLATSIALTTPTLIYNYDDNDLIVPLSSQKGGLGEKYYSYDFIDLSHSVSITNAENIRIVIELLKKNPNNSDYFTTAPFEPPSLKASTPLFSFRKNSARAIDDSCRVMITNPSNGTVTFPDNKMDITISSHGDIRKILFAASTQQNSLVSEVMETSAGIFQYTVPKNASGIIKILAVGITASGSVSIDSISLPISVSASLDSISVYPKQVTLPKGQKAYITINGYYNDGSMRNICGDPNVVSISTDLRAVKVLTSTQLLADSIGFADMNIEYFGKTDHLSVTVLPADAFVTSIDLRNKELIVSDCKLFQNYPNPFNPSTTIKYSLSHARMVKIQIFDILGREVATIINETKPAGTYDVLFNAASLSSGVYFYRLQAGSYMDIKKLILLR